MELLLSNPNSVLTESSYHNPKIARPKPGQCIRTPTPGVGRFSQNTTTYIFLKEEYHKWLDENHNGEYTLKQRMEDGHRHIYLIGDETMLLMFKLACL